MLKTACINPILIKTLAECGHGDKILIADGNYPINSNFNPAGNKVYVSLTRGMPLVTDVLDIIGKMISIENVEVMLADTGEEPTIYKDFRKILSDEIKLNKLERFEFYEACKEENVKLAIATGEPRIFANILLTVGVV